MTQALSAFYLLDFESPVGFLEIVTDEGQLHSVSFSGVRKPSDKTLRLSPETKLEQRLFCMLSRYFKGEKVEFNTVPITLPTGSEFFIAVLKALQAIPYGEIRNYHWLASFLGNPKASRAVGGALGRNPLPIILPCHRVVTKTGAIGGFMRTSAMEGRRTKAFLLGLEGVDINFESH